MLKQTLQGCREFRGLEISGEDNLAEGRKNSGTKNRDF